MTSISMITKLDFVKMAPWTPRFLFLQILFIVSLLVIPTLSDPDPLQDYCVADQRPSTFFINGIPCLNPALAASSHFTTSALSKPGNTRANIFGFNVTLTNPANLPGLNTQGLTMARTDLAGLGVVPLHSHPRASEVTVCIKGELFVGFIDASNRLFTQRLRVGESFVFPKGLIHFLYNESPKASAAAVSGFNSQSPGAQLASLAAFTSRPMIPDEVLKKAFQINGQDLSRIRRNLGG